MIDYETHKKFAEYLYEIREMLMKEIKRRRVKTKTKLERKSLDNLERLRNILDELSYRDHKYSPYYRGSVIYK